MAFTYSVFKFLNKKASDDFNRTIIAWIKGEHYKRVDLSAAVIGAFDHLYSAPLLRLTAFARSAALSILSSGIFFILIDNGIGLAKNDTLLPLLFALPIIGADYLSLFAVRRCLGIATINIWASVAIALLCAFAAIELAMAIFVILWSVLAWFTGNNPSLLVLLNLDITLITFDIAHPLEAIKSFAPALVVHLWLPLFLLGAAGTRFVNAFFRAVGFAQWFIKQGGEHPLDAIGMIASVIVFVAAVAFKAVGYLWP